MFCPSSTACPDGKKATYRKMNQPEVNFRRFATIAIQGLVITIVASSLVVLFTSSGETLDQLRNNVRWNIVPLLALPVFLSWCCNGTRFYLMCRCLGHPLSFRRALGIAISSEFGVAASPGGVGGTAVRLGFLKKAGVPLAHSGAVLAADVVLDIVFFGLLTPFAVVALWRHLPEQAGRPFQDVSPAWWLVLLAPALLYGLRKRIARSIAQHAAWQKHRMGGRIRLARKKAAHSYRQGRIATALIFRNHRGLLLVNLLLTAVQFSSRYSILPLAICLLGIPVDPLPLIVMQGALYMVSMVTVAPGGGGSVEILAAFALPQFMPANLVGVAILLWRLFTYHFYLLFGGGKVGVRIGRAGELHCGSQKARHRREVPGRRNFRGRSGRVPACTAPSRAGLSWP